MDLGTAIRLLLLLGVANLAPLLAQRIWGARAARPLDGGMRFVDGQPLLGRSKTVRGLAVSVVATALAAPVLGLGALQGAQIGAFAMLGDAFSSFVKRRLRIPSSGRAPVLDQVPEALLPLWSVHEALGLSVPEVLALTLAFLLLEPPLARLWHRLGWRDTPW